MSIQNQDSQSQTSLQKNWSLVDESRSTMAKEIKSLANSISGPRSRQLKSVSGWLKGSRGFEEALERPDVLCFCQPWVDAILSKPDREPLSEFEITTAIGVGFCKFDNTAPLPRDLTPFMYPLIAFLAWLAMLAFGSVFLLPHFRTMFEEFGIELPWSTQFIIRVGLWFEASWMLLFNIVILGPILLWMFLRFSQVGKAYSLNWLDRKLSKFRTKLSIWATHVAGLLAAGVSETQAIQIAGRCSSSSMLEARCDDFVQDRNQSLLDPARYPLINNSLSLSNKAAKIRILEETARYYQSVSRIVQSWWLTWLSKAILVLIVATLLFVISSLFAPLISIVSGLTG